MLRYVEAALIRHAYRIMDGGIPVRAIIRLAACLALNPLSITTRDGNVSIFENTNIQVIEMSWIVHA